MSVSMDLAEFVNFCKRKHSDIYIYDTAVDNNYIESAEEIQFRSEFNKLAVFYSNQSLIFYNAVCAVRFSGIKQVIVHDEDDHGRAECDLICVCANGEEFLERIVV